MAKTDIKIKESKKGTFTRAAKKRGMGVQEFAKKVMANKDRYSDAMVKKANFARNATKWEHQEGGEIGQNPYIPFAAVANNEIPNYSLGGWFKEKVKDVGEFTGLGKVADFAGDIVGSDIRGAVKDVTGFAADVGGDYLTYSADNFLGLAGAGDVIDKEAYATKAGGAISDVTSKYIMPAVGMGMATALGGPMAGAALGGVQQGVSGGIQQGKQKEQQQLALAQQQQAAARQAAGQQAMAGYNQGQKYAPTFQSGGEVKGKELDEVTVKGDRVVRDAFDPRYRAYTDSLNLYNEVYDMAKKESDIAAKGNTDLLRKSLEETAEGSGVEFWMEEKKEHPDDPFYDKQIAKAKKEQKYYSDKKNIDKEVKDRLKHYETGFDDRTGYQLKHGKKKKGDDSFTELLKPEDVKDYDKYLEGFIGYREEEIAEALKEGKPRVSVSGMAATPLAAAKTELENAKRLRQLNKSDIRPTAYAGGIESLYLPTYKKPTTPYTLYQDPEINPRGLPQQDNINVAPGDLREMNKLTREDLENSRVGKYSGGKWQSTSGVRPPETYKGRPLPSGEEGRPFGSYYSVDQGNGQPTTLTPEEYNFIKESGQMYNPQFAGGGKISNKISTLVKEGYPQDQAVAIAYDMKRKNKFQSGGKKGEDTNIFSRAYDSIVNLRRDAIDPNAERLRNEYFKSKGVKRKDQLSPEDRNYFSRYNLALNQNHKNPKLNKATPETLDSIIQNSPDPLSGGAFDKVFKGGDFLGEAGSLKDILTQDKAYKYQLGGEIQQPNAELEGGESIELPNGEGANIEGPSHAQGGVEMNLPEGTEIYSDELKVPNTNKTFSKANKELQKKMTKYEKILENDRATTLARNTAKKMLSKLEQEQDQLFQQQQQLNGDSTGERGGQQQMQQPQMQQQMPQQQMQQPMGQQPQFQEGGLTGLNPFENPQLNIDTSTLAPTAQRSTAGMSQYSPGILANLGAQAGGAGGMLGTAATLAPALYNIGRGLFGKTEEINPSDYYNPYEASALNTMRNRSVNVDPMLEANRAAERTGKYNLRSGARTRGELLSGYAPLSAARSRADMDAYSRQQQLENQYAGQTAQMEAQLGQQRASTRFKVDDVNARARAAQRNMTGTGLSQLSQYAQLRTQRKGLQEADAARVNMLKEMYPQFWESLVPENMKPQ